MLGVKRIERVLPTGTSLTVVGEVPLLTTKIIYTRVVIAISGVKHFQQRAVW